MIDGFLAISGNSITLLLLNLVSSFPSRQCPLSTRFSKGQLRTGARLSPTQYHIVHLLVLMINVISLYPRVESPLMSAFQREFWHPSDIVEYDPIIPVGMFL